jgi:toxin FitB
VSFLLDTNVVSEIRKQAPDAGVAEWFASVERLARAWGRLNVPDPVPVVDGLMAATALVHDWTLVTRSVDNVRSTGVRLLNPFSEGSKPG